MSACRNGMSKGGKIRAGQTYSKCKLWYPIVAMNNLIRSLFVMVMVASVGTSCLTVDNANFCDVNKKCPDTTVCDLRTQACIAVPDAGSTEICQSYCAAAMANCTGENVLYPDLPSCHAACEAMPLGLESDMTGNSASCRNAMAILAKNDVTRCKFASISSADNLCGFPCEAYCDQAMAHCFSANKLYDNRTACELQCSQFPRGSFSDTTGNTIQCRAYHASFPAAADPQTHCEHAGETGAGICVGL